MDFVDREYFLKESSPPEDMNIISISEDDFTILARTLGETIKLADPCDFSTLMGVTEKEAAEVHARAIHLIRNLR